MRASDDGAFCGVYSFCVVAKDVTAQRDVSILHFNAGGIGIEGIFVAMQRRCIGVAGNGNPGCVVAKVVVGEAIVVATAVDFHCQIVFLEGTMLDVEPARWRQYCGCALFELAIRQLTFAIFTPLNACIKSSECAVANIPRPMRASQSVLAHGRPFGGIESAIFDFGVS